MCFSTPKVETTPLPSAEGADEKDKTNTLKQAKKRKGYSSTILAGDISNQTAPTEQKRLLGQ